MALAQLTAFAVEDLPAQRVAALMQVALGLHGAAVVDVVGEWCAVAWMPVTLWTGFEGLAELVVVQDESGDVRDGEVEVVAELAVVAGQRCAALLELGVALRRQ